VIASTAAIFLVGGKSSRMEQPKALLEFDGEPLIVHLVRRLEPHFPERIVVAAEGQMLPELDAQVVVDEIPDQGPLGGLYSGLRAAAAEVAFVTACDVPFLSVELAALLVGRLGAASAVVPRFDGRLQPLHAAYRCAVADVFRRRLATGERRTIEAAATLDPVVVDEEELRAFDPEGLSFRNLNFPEDYAAALTLWPRRRP